MGDFDNAPNAIIQSNVVFDEVKKGRGNFTKNPEDNYKFKTPTLYNLIDNGFYGHGGTFTSVEEVIDYKNEGIPQNTEVPVENLATQFVDLKLTKKQVENLTLFIENGLRDPELQRYTPDFLNSGFCFPNADAQSRLDLGCD